jgi:hypothetical protein
MKTAKQTNQHFPRPGRITLYMFAVAALCFLNWVVLHAQPAENTDQSRTRLAAVLTEEVEPEVQLQDWMMDFENVSMAVTKEAEIKVEPWMLTFNRDYMTDGWEPELNFEPWMVNFEQRCLLVEKEKDVPLEQWKVSTCTWGCTGSMMARN